MWFWSAFTLAWLVALIFAEQRGSAPLRAVAKTTASLGFLLTAVAAGALRGDWQAIAFGALVSCAIGDVALLGRSPGAFLGGLAAFLLGHLGFCVAFVALGPSWPIAGLTALALVYPAAVVARWLQPHVPKPLWGPVLAYIVVICLMVALAFGSALAHGHWLLLLGALAFFASDLSVARDRFVSEDWVNRAWGLPLYYGAQLCFAWALVAG